MEKILVVENESDIQTQMKWGLSKDYAVLQATNRPSAMKIFGKEQPSVVTLDLGLPPDEDGSAEGLACLGEILKRSPQTKVIVITGNDERATALKAIQMGAYDYYQKPVDMDELKVILKRASHLAEIENENRELHNVLERESGFSGMVGQSPEMQRVFETIRKVATTDAAVLITGESGTGKELVARAIHDNSSRKKGPFIAINCGAIPEELLESELFGHEKGAFTGAHLQQTGKFELADKGTLFLDEIGEMSPRLQVKLLRFLQDKTIQRVGGRTDIEIDARIVVATNIDLNTAMKERKFREDLFFRISVISIDVPPLRERGADINLLANVFLERYNLMFNKKIKAPGRSVIDAINNYSWPGNVRELENKLQKAVIIADGRTIKPADLGLENIDLSDTSFGKIYSGLTLRQARRKLEVELIEKAISKNRGNIKRASEDLGITRPTLYDLIEKYNLSVKDGS